MRPVPVRQSRNEEWDISQPPKFQRKNEYENNCYCYWNLISELFDLPFCKWCCLDSWIFLEQISRRECRGL